MGHTMSIHSQNDQIVLEFGLKKPAFRIVVNSPTTFGSIGLTTGLDPAMTLGCGGYGGNITSDNISPRHLLNTKRLAYEITPVANRFERAAGTAPRPTPKKAPPTGITAEVLTAKIDQFLGARGFRTAAPPDASVSGGSGSAGTAARPASGGQPVLDFVCEDDVRTALKDGQTLLVSERAIITPSARELGERHRIFQTPPYRG
jgi:acetaldehyde dehydrogenase (acetylating)